MSCETPFFSVLARNLAKGCTSSNAGSISGTCRKNAFIYTPAATCRVGLLNDAALVSTRECETRRTSDYRCELTGVPSFI